MPLVRGLGSTCTLDAGACGAANVIQNARCALYSQPGWDLGYAYNREPYNLGESGGRPWGPGLRVRVFRAWDEEERRFGRAGSRLDP